MTMKLALKSGRVVQLFELVQVAPDDFERNELRKASRNCDHNCSRCGRPVDTNSKKLIWVECIAGGYVCVPALQYTDAEREEIENLDCYMGCHPVGPKCAKEVPPEYHFKKGG